MNSIVILGAKRTALGALLGQFTGVAATHLGATAIKAAMQQSGVQPENIDEVIMGCVLPAGLGQAPARQAALGAGIPVQAGATTINKVCGSGMKAVMFASDLIKAGSAEVVVAGGMESMTNAPHLLMGSRTGTRYGNTELIDHMAWDGLTNPYDKQSMGVFGELCVEKYGFSREQQDAFAIASVQRALNAQATGAFDAEITPVQVTTRKGEVLIAQDEQPGRCDTHKIPTLRASFKKDGTITAASSSSINDGAAALVLASSDFAHRHGLTPQARIVAQASFSQAPEWFTTAPIGAIQSVLAKAGWKLEEVDLFEINEAFATVAMAPIHELGIPHEKVNVNGGACALGHPIGASGARIIVTLLYALQARGLRKGVASLCIGGGEATAIAIEIV
ncbi:MAG: acetyl-CoA C-acetyltransferase [Arenimonas sp.]|nr:acetyl-CoA C-acetyltransferase [Arenimonas sp.]